GQKGIAGAVTKCSDKACVIRRAVMVDVVRAKRRACHPLEQIVFFVRSAVRTDKANRIASAGIENLFEPCRGSLRSLFPRDGIKFVALANQGLSQALGVLREIKAEAPLNAEKIFVDAGKVAVIRAHDFVIAYAQRRFAPVRTVRAN